ncbi:pancreatic triacylglycerol lipase-like, partial [Palaemon carinicauda]|uniref:pancreatic triacylglycerol lipase-like n=1 Tax=Palaemon carinicauda TaxID=392227 RepID=UPI0035B5A69B
KILDYFLLGSASEVPAPDPETDNIVTPIDIDDLLLPLENVTLPDISLEDFILKVNLSDVHFLLWTRSNNESSSYYELFIDDVSNLKASPFDKDKPTVILTHGFRDNGKSSWIYQSKTEFLEYQDCNFIAIDWRKIAGHIIYTEIVNNLPEVGKHVAVFVDYLHTEGELNLTSVYAIGHSLGAHMIGIMGSNVQNGSVGRITGLDPAGPGFDFAPSDKRLDQTDALFVDIIHSHACAFSDLCLGLNGSYGHVDFFPNGGRRQPGCTLLGDLFDTLSGCSHRRSRIYWIESINGKTPFRSVPCSDWNSYKTGNCSDCGQGCLEMGVHVNTQMRGNYYLETNAFSPYARG